MVIVNIVATVFLLIYVILYLVFEPTLNFKDGHCYLWYTIKDKYSTEKYREYIKIY